MIEEIIYFLRDYRWPMTGLVCGIAFLGCAWDRIKGQDRPWKETGANVAIFVIGQILHNAFLLPFKILLLINIPSLVPRMPLTWWSFALSLFAIDLVFYILHRFEHTWKPLWAEHSIHHNSNEFNFSIGLRLPWFNPFQGWPAIPLVLMGFPPIYLLGAMPINQFFQYWVHSADFPKMDWLEHVLMTPSNHRVHHAQNPRYRNHNFGGMFIFWDKLFGTYQREEENDPPVYHGSDSINTANPFLINFLPLKYLWRSKSNNSL
jgi:sterol desaturase/sphingolipid hydroxylase (fatty acid hydroxylase superfamily)